MAKGDLEYFRPVTFAVAVGATQVDVAEKLHLDMLETVTLAPLTATIAGIETKHAGRVAASLGQVLASKQLADFVKCSNVTGRVRAGCFSDW